MFRYYILIIGCILITGCKEVYDPDIENNKTAIVIQGLITNIQGQMSVRITTATPYDSTINRIPVRGALVSVYDDLGSVYMLSDDGFGRYENSDAIGVSGRAYYLKVETLQGDIYESVPQVMPVAFQQDSIYAANINRTIYVPSVSGNYIKSQRTGIETYVDLSSKSNELPKCRYDLLGTVLYSYIGEGTPPPTIYCWKSFNPSPDLNITTSKFDKVIGFAPKHNVGFFGTNIILYDERPNLTVEGWLLSINKYNLSSESHQYYTNIKNQLEASGKIFDPVPSQINGNIKCINNPGKLVFGFFEVSFAEKLYYKYNIGQQSVLLTPKDGFPGFTPEGEVPGIPPPFWYY